MITGEPVPTPSLDEGSAFGPSLDPRGRSPEEITAFIHIVPDSVDVEQRATYLVAATWLLGGSRRPGYNGWHVTQAVEGIERPGPTGREARGHPPDCEDLARQLFYMASGVGELTVARNTERTSEEELVIGVMNRLWGMFKHTYQGRGVQGQQARRRFRNQLQPEEKPRPPRRSRGGGHYA